MSTFFRLSVSLKNMPKGACKLRSKYKEVIALTNLTEKNKKTKDHNMYIQEYVYLR